MEFKLEGEYYFMTLIKSLIIAFGTYSKVPMPRVTVDKDQDKFTLVFFPVVGLFIAVLSWILFFFCDRINCPDIVRVCGLILIPLALTGGIHMDGFMDCMDALSSYKSREEKLAILSDPHIGAFSVIKVIELVAVYIIAASFIRDGYWSLLPVGFITARALSGFSVMTFDLAKDKGMCAYTRGRAANFCSRICLLEFFLVSCISMLLYGYAAVLAVAVNIFCLLYYRYRSKNDFGGITGDTAGCFLVMTELAWVLAVGAYCLLRQL